MLSFIPFIGPIISGIITPIISIFTKVQDKDIVAIKTAGEVTVAETQESTKVIQATEGDWGVRLARDVVIWPWCLWLGGYGWDTFVTERWHWLYIGIADPPTSVAYIPYAVLVFLLGNIGLNMWNRK